MPASPTIETSGVAPAGGIGPAGLLGVALAVATTATSAVLIVGGCLLLMRR